MIHFLGAPAPEDLVAQMAEAYLGADTQLMTLYEVMLADPRAWQPGQTKARTPFEFIVEKWASEPHRFSTNPSHLIPGPNI